jgi:hypothetical protein
MQRKMAAFVFVAALLAAVPASAFEARIDPMADKIFKQMCDYVASLTSFTVEEDMAEDKVFPNGEKLEFNKTAVIQARRPDKLRSDATGDAGGKTVVVINGPKFSVYKSSDNVYGELDVPPALDASLDYVLEKLAVNAPTSDLFKDDPYAAIMPGVLEAAYVGDAKIGGKACRHLAFRQLEVDWQVWVAYGDRPLPLRVVITDKTLHGNPQHRVTFTKWDVKAKIADKAFRYAPPKDAQKIDLIVSGGQDGSGASGAAD